MRRSFFLRIALAFASVLRSARYSHGGFLRNSRSSAQPCAIGQRSPARLRSSSLEQRTPSEARQRVVIESPPPNLPGPIAKGSASAAHAPSCGCTRRSRPREKSRPGPPPGLGGIISAMPRAPTVSFAASARMYRATHFRPPPGWLSPRWMQRPVKIGASPPPGSALANCCRLVTLTAVS